MGDERGIAFRSATPLCEQANRYAFILCHFWGVTRRLTGKDSVSINLNQSSRLTTLETGYLVGLRLVLSLEFNSQPSSRLSNCIRCPSHSTGNGPIRSFKVRCAGCLPASMVPSTFGVRNASGMAQLTKDAQILCSPAIDSRHS